MSRPDPRRAVAVLAIVLGLLAGAAQAQERLLPAAKVFPFLREYLALGPTARDRFTPIYVLVPKLGTLAGARLSLVVDGRRTPLAMQPDGQIGIPTSAADIARGQVAVSLPPGSRIAVRIDVAAILPPRSEIPVALLEASLAQANGALHTGLPFLTPPPFRRLVFQGVDGGEVVAADGQRAALPIRDGVPYYAPSRAGRDRALRFRQPPLHVILMADN